MESQRITTWRQLIDTAVVCAEHLISNAVTKRRATYRLSLQSTNLSHTAKRFSLIFIYFPNIMNIQLAYSRSMHVGLPVNLRILQMNWWNHIQ